MSPSATGGNIADESAAAPVPAGTPPGSKQSRGIMIGAGIILALLVIAVAGYALLGSGIMAGTGPTTPAPSPTPTSYVIIETEPPTPEPTTPPVVITTTSLPTTTITTPLTTKPVFCAADRLKCNNTCVDIRTDTNNCGYCGKVCPSGQFCLNTQCTKTCTSGQTSCPDGCFNLQSDRDHCGTCQNDCPKGLICYQGQCTAPETPMILAE